MRQDFIEFAPSHTAVMVTNHKPRVSGDDPALWRRIRVVPFDVVIAEPDAGLPDRLVLELPAVLAWTVAGYQFYAEKGLAAPRVVTERTKDYQVSSGAVARFIDKRTLVSPFAHVRARELFGAWSSGCHNNGEAPGSEVDFAVALAGRGFEKVKRVAVMTYLGLGLAAEGEEEGM